MLVNTWKSRCSSDTTVFSEPEPNKLFTGAEVKWKTVTITVCDSFWSEWEEEYQCTVHDGGTLVRTTEAAGTSGEACYSGLGLTYAVSTSRCLCLWRFQIWNGKLYSAHITTAWLQTSRCSNRLLQSTHVTFGASECTPQVLLFLISR